MNLEAGEAVAYVVEAVGVVLAVDERNTNDFSLGVGNGGNSLRFTWSVVHGDRRPVSGLIPTDCARPAFSGSLWSVSTAVEP